MIRFIYSALGMMVLLAGLTPSSSKADSSEGVWKTAFYKRGFVGSLHAPSGGGERLTLRAPVPIYFAGSKVRVWMQSHHAKDFQLGKMTLAKGIDRQGEISGPATPILFDGKPDILIPARSASVVSNEMPVAVTEGVWYLQQSYVGPQLAYTYDADGYFRETGDAHDLSLLSDQEKGSWPGNARRIDVLTTDPRGVIACYGDSITQGAGSTPTTGNRYPEKLAELLGQPTLNLGVNGDLAALSHGVPGLIKSLNGVETLIFLMGINDIVSDKMIPAEDYILKVSQVVRTVNQMGIRVYLGTILPAGGHAKFDADPAKEQLRQTINEWIRNSGTNVEGYIDFDQALRDPVNPTRIKEEYQADWLHPNDAGYQKMAEVATEKLKPLFEESENKGVRRNP